MDDVHDLEMDPDDVHTKIEADEVTLMDIRGESERQRAVLEDDLWIPMDELPKQVDQLRNANTPIVVYCHHGIRSLKVSQYLRNEGFDEVYSLAGGIDAWSKTIDESVPTY